MFEILINSVDRTEYIKKNSLQIRDILTSQVDSGKFDVIGKDWLPNKGDEILIYYDSVLKFGGRITDVDKENRIYSRVSVKFQDWSVDFNRIRIAKVYEGYTAKEIIEDIVLTINAGTGMTFTTANVQTTQVLGKVVFNYREGSKCVEDLANALNFQWYIDENKDVHFFAKGSEVAPFSVTDSSVDVIRGTLGVNDSISELRNVSIVRGGEFEALARSENYVADGEQVLFNLAYKYSKLPDVELDAVALSVGVENLDNNELEDGTFDCLWDYNQKYLRFKTAPVADKVLAIEGTPLFPLIVVAEHPESIAEYGRKEYVLDDLNITSQDVAIQRAISDLNSYKDGVISGGFETYTHGLRSGQTITIQSDLLDVDESFLIRSVTTRDFGEGAHYSVELMNNRIVGIIEFLQSLLMAKRGAIGIREGEVPNILKLDSQIVFVEEQITRVLEKFDHQDIEIEEQIRGNPFEAEFVIAPYFPVDEDDPKTPMRIDISSYIY